MLLIVCQANFNEYKLQRQLVDVMGTLWTLFQWIMAVYLPAPFLYACHH